MSGPLRAVILMAALIGGVAALVCAAIYEHRALENRSERGKGAWWLATNVGVLAGPSYFTPLGWRYRVRSMVAGAGVVAAVVICILVY